MKLIKFNQFERVNALLEKYSLEQIRDEKVYEGSTEFAGMSHEEVMQKVVPVYEFLGGAGRALLNFITSKIPGTAVSKANKILSEYERMYRGKGKEELEIAKSRYDLRMKKQEADDSIEMNTSIEALRKNIDKREELNKKKWDAIDAALEAKISALKKEFADNDRVRAYIDTNLAEMRVRVYSSLEKQYQKYASEEEMERFHSSLEAEKKRFLKYKADLEKKANQEKEKSKKPELPPAESEKNDDEKEDKPDPKAPKVPKAGETWTRISPKGKKQEVLVLTDKPNKKGLYQVKLLSQEGKEQKSGLKFMSTAARLGEKIK